MKYLILFCTVLSLLPCTPCLSQGAEGSTPQSPEPVTSEYFDETVHNNLQAAKEKALRLIDLHTAHFPS
ncbi:MAG: hypothetical protein D3906_11160, partial [Candidatus Electrothrix sp. AUS1_2]|nr:hypothetical protein [Candidatus Electrothrix sp. AUS1_2]